MAECVITVKGIGSVICCAGSKRESVGCILYYDYDRAKVIELLQRAQNKVITELYADPKKCSISNPPPGLFDIRKIKTEFTIDEKNIWYWSRMKGKYPSVPLEGYFNVKESNKAAELGMAPLPQKSEIRLLLRELRITSTYPIKDRVSAARKLFDKYPGIAEEFVERFSHKDLPENENIAGDYMAEAEIGECEIGEIYCLHAADVMSLLYFPRAETEVVAANLMTLERKALV